MERSFIKLSYYLAIFAYSACYRAQPHNDRLMKRFCPLPDTHPEFSILDDIACREYRVENWHLARDGSGKVIRGISRFTGFDAFALAVIAVLWWQVLYEKWLLNQRI